MLEVHPPHDSLFRRCQSEEGMAWLEHLFVKIIQELYLECK